MKKAVITLAIVVTFLGHVFGQNPNFKVKWGKEFKAPNRSSLNDIVGMMLQEFT